MSLTRELRFVFVIEFPLMNSFFCRIFATFFVLAFVAFASADDFKSMVIPSGGPTDLPRIHGDQFMVIRNFTQEGSAIIDPRGVVTVTKPPTSVTPVNVLAAAILDPSESPEVINSVVIAGPADVSVTCGSMTGDCFISFKKDSN